MLCFVQRFLIFWRMCSDAGATTTQAPNLKSVGTVCKIGHELGSCCNFQMKRPLFDKYCVSCNDFQYFGACVRAPRQQPAKCIPQETSEPCVKSVTNWVVVAITKRLCTAPADSTVPASRPSKHGSGRQRRRHEPAGLRAWHERQVRSSLR